MSMAEALKSLRGKVPWLQNDGGDEFSPPKIKSPSEDAEDLLSMAKQPGAVDRSSLTWAAVSRWCASELISVHLGLEAAVGDKAAFLRARAKTLRDMLEMDKPCREIRKRDYDGPVIP